MLFAVAAIASVSCQKEILATNEEQTYMTFTSVDPVSKTEWNGQTIVWSQGDNIRIACHTGQDAWYVSGSTPSAKLYASEAAEQGGESVKFRVKTGSSSFPADLAGNLRFFALYPSSVEDASFSQETSCASIEIGDQKTSSNTYDSSADILWGKSVKTYQTIPTEDVSILWSRVVAHACISLNKINGIVQGEKVNKITLTAQQGAILTGTFDLNMANGDFSPTKTVSNTITLSCENVVADASGNVTFWACINPCTITSLDFTVETDVATYTCSKSGFSREFLQNKRNILPVDMSGATRTEKEVEEVTGYYVKVTEAPADGDWSGTYLLVCEGTNEIMGPMDEDCFVAVEYEILENKIPRTAKTTAYQLVISKNASNVYSLCVDSKFVGATASNKTTLSFSELLQDGNAAYQWTITLNNLNNADIANVGCDGRYLKRSSTSTALKFAAYASGAKPVQLYKLQN